VYGLELAAVMEAGEAKWPKVEAGLGTVNDIGHDIADDGPEPEPVPAHPGGDDKTAWPAATVDDR
jgi:hypothetical protein